MTNTEEILEHPVFGERAVVTKSAEDTGGDSLWLKYYLAPRQSVTMEHVHPVQKEHLTVLSGTIQVRVNETMRTVEPGQKVQIPPRAQHVYWNAGDEEAVVQVEFRPALQMEGFLKAFYALAQAGQVSLKTGLPRTIEMVVLLNRYRDEIQIALMPKPVQSALFAGLAFAGRLRGLWTKQGHPHVRAVRL